MGLIKHSVQIPGVSRSISKTEWEAAGVENQDTVVWNQENAWAVDESKLNEHALEVLKKSGGFVFPGASAEEKTQAVSQAVVDDRVQALRNAGKDREADKVLADAAKQDVSQQPTA